MTRTAIFLGRDERASAPEAGVTDTGFVLGAAAIAAVAWALLWILLPVWSDLSPSGDNVEQIVWSQGFELGYHKHPPLPTWILIGAEQFVAPSLPLTYALSVLGMLVGAAFLWRLAGELLGSRASLPAVLATGCIAFFSWRAHVFNHNTVMVPIVYASAWLFLRAVRTGSRNYWALFGVAVAAGMLTKYQYAVVLSAFAVIAIRLRLYRQRAVLPGLVLSASVALLLLLPHIWWLVSNDFPPFRYAEKMVLARLGTLDRLDVSGGFLLQQMRDGLVAAGLVGLAVWLSGAKRKQMEEAPAADARVWVLALGFVPLTFMLLLGLFAGVRLENHWGMMVLQFAALPILYWFRGRRLVPMTVPLLVTFLSVQAAEAVHYVRVEQSDRSRTLEGGAVTAFDPRSLARSVETDWQGMTDQPLRYIVGSTTWGGYISLYSTTHPQVMIGGDASASPWVSTRSVADCGAVYIDPIQPPPGTPISRRGEWTTVDYSNKHQGEPLKVRWVIVAPSARCKA
ncbi:MAG TPA: glycosyltransferase family 39 protein [Steroidobacteraceae bacterium]|jgi:4-amino-4-deoxy-L-arabinose transferase-like glycosyltransferase